MSASLRPSAPPQAARVPPGPLSASPACCGLRSQLCYNLLHVYLKRTQAKRLGVCGGQCDACRQCWDTLRHV